MLPGSLDLRNYEIRETFWRVKLSNMLLYNFLKQSQFLYPYPDELLKFIPSRYWGSGTLLWEFKYQRKLEERSLGSILSPFKSMWSCGVGQSSASDMGRGYLQEVLSTRAPAPGTVPAP